MGWLVISEDRAIVGGDQAGDHVETGGLAGPVGAQQARHFAAGEVQADALDHRASTERLADAVDDQAFTSVLLGSGGGNVQRGGVHH